MANETTTIVLPASGTGTVVQSIKTAALWTFLQAFVGSFSVSVLPVITLIQADLQDAGPFDNSNLIIVGWLALSALAGAIGAVISLVKNYFKTTLPAGESVVAQAQP